MKRIRFRVPEWNSESVGRTVMVLRYVRLYKNVKKNSRENIVTKTN